MQSGQLIIHFLINDLILIDLQVKIIRRHDDERRFHLIVRHVYPGVIIVHLQADDSVLCLILSG